MSQATVTTDHDEIRRWIEERGGRPSRVKDTGGKGQGKGKGGPGILRVDFGEPDDSLEPISWEEFFEAFEDNDLAFLHQDEAGSSRGGGKHQPSRFNKFVHRSNDR
jgi:hypothetical protein